VGGLRKAFFTPKRPSLSLLTVPSLRGIITIDDPSRNDRVKLPRGLPYDPFWTDAIRAQKVLRKTPENTEGVFQAGMDEGTEGSGFPALEGRRSRGLS